jgi:dihydrolipoamide dehydrogenase
MPTFDVVVLGAGSTGEVVAGRVASRSMTVAVVERDLVGGDCSYYACIPSKALLRPSGALASARAVDGAEEAVAGDLDVAAVLARRNRFVGDWDDSGALPWLDEHDIRLFRGHARLVNARTVVVHGRDGSETVLAARAAVVVCTGSAPSVPDIPGLRDAAPWTTRDAVATQRVPERLVVLGGGPAACEIATAFRSFGADVTVVARSDLLLPHMEPFAGDAVRTALETAGACVRTGTSLTRVARGRDGTVQVMTNSGEMLHADEIVVATGRRPRTDDLGVERVGVEPGAWLDVDDQLRVRGVPGEWLYAAGDVTHRARLTHMGKYEARICADAIAAAARGGAPADVCEGRWPALAATADHWAVPQVVFTEPEVAAVGLTERAAREQLASIRVVEHDLDVAGARLLGDFPTGRARMVVDTDREVVVGMTLVGPHVGELLHAATIAIVGEVPIARLWHAVPSFPTVSEVWLRLLEALDEP